MSTTFIIQSSGCPKLTPPTVSKRNGRGFKIDRASTTPGSPNILVVTAAALRAADLTRALKIYQNKEAAVAKLFAKHVKLREHVEYLMKTRIGIGVGTPGRLMDLMREGMLGLRL